MFLCFHLVFKFLGWVSFENSSPFLHTLLFCPALGSNGFNDCFWMDDNAPFRNDSLMRTTVEFQWFRSKSKHWHCFDFAEINDFWFQNCTLHMFLWTSLTRIDFILLRSVDWLTVITHFLSVWWLLMIIRLLLVIQSVFLLNVFSVKCNNCNFYIQHSKNVIFKAASSPELQFS